MTKKVLIAYTTNAGSTAEVAQAIGKELYAAAGLDAAHALPGSPAEAALAVDVRRLEEVTGVDGYDVVIVGAPMILGWHRAAVSFVRKHRAALAGKQVAYFCTAMSLTETGERELRGVPVCVDPGLAKLPQRLGRLGIKERYATLGNYLRPVLGAAPGVTPLSVAFFGGKLEIFRLKWWQALFVMAIIQASPSDLRSFPVIRQWARDLYGAL